MAAQSAFRKRPISARSPLPFLLLVSESDQCSWSATLSLACCSSNLLEPSPLCARWGVRSRNFECFESLFINLFFVVFQLFGEIPAWISCGKNRAPGGRFGMLGAIVRRLIIRPGAIEDFIVSLPALECLREEERI